MNDGRGSDVLMEKLDGIGFDDWREWVTARARGRVLEIGAGTGLNFSYYQDDARVVAFDPDPEQLDEVDSSEARAHHVRLAQASAEDLPFPDAAFDAAVGTLVFCTIPNAARALAEVKRV